METSAINIHAELISRCGHGDRVAQYELYGLYSKAMFNTAMRITGSREDAEDVLQESFVSAFRKIDTYQAEASFGAWLKRIVINKAISLLKRNRRMMEVDIEAEGEFTAGPEPEEISMTVEAVKSAVEKLPVGFRTVLTLYLFEGYDHGEISEILGISESTSKTQYKRAKEKLKTILNKKVTYG